MHELPLIWGELIEAGFETGHAYGKSTRTVKSCVGSTWCRYGVQDSVGMALRLEDRYKGLRSPHKLKFAVSGCTRECAEAQSKDIGVIATDKGWNLYVCGNGGMRPRHAELFATDLDDETLVRLIDRVLMFYIRTADKLQRTSVWRENLEGGLDYLKQVIIDDSLGLASELEAQMQHVVDQYECEWANALNDPEAQALPYFRQRPPRRPGRALRARTRTAPACCTTALDPNRRGGCLMNLSNAAVKTHENWQAVCQADDLVADSGVVVWLDGAQVALFYLPGQAQPLYAVDNRDPRSGANIIGRGLVGSVQGELVVAAPLYKQHFSLQSGSAWKMPGSVCGCGRCA